MITPEAPYEVPTLVFSSHYSTSFSRSVLTLEKPAEIKQNSPVSICSIAQTHKIDKLFLIDSSFSGFQEAYRNLTEINVQLIFGVKFHICDDVLDKSEKGCVNDSKIYLIAKNKKGYKELVKIYSEAATNGFYYYPRLDWLQLNEVSENIDVWVSFYDGFIFNNLLNHGVSIIPRFNKVKPKFCIESHELPFDDLVENGVNKYCKDAGFETIRTHQTSYYKNSDAKTFQVYKCIGNRSTSNKPNLSHFCSDKFSYEAWDKDNPFFDYSKNIAL